ncbi:phage head closure protein [Falsiruegeria mediterranea]|uniref:phage head closure protein n=1 Tax=Falsiruegeria mediterranea TaxID=1280832 RepID=UPI0015F26EA5|nr:phage head closure protein [Falsiruegeria mediterranea]
MNIGNLDRRITLRTRQAGKNALGELLKGFDDGPKAWAAYSPVSDGERIRGGHVEGVSAARFVVRYSASMAAITGDDRLMFDGREWQITGVKTLGRRRWIEISAWTK